MTLWDDVPTLLTKLRHTFITSDETGLSEMVITQETVTRDEWNIKENCIVYKKNGGNKMSVSPDIYPEVDYGVRRHRRRSQTDERLEKMKRDQQAATTQHVAWKEPSQISDSDREELFTRKEVNAKPVSPVVKSVLSEQLERSIPDLPFREYAKFDSMANPGTHAKSLEIFTTMASPDQRAYPLRVVVLNSSTVREVIGLICWLYTRNERSPALSENIDLYELYMEDSGEADTDFPALDKRELISKFGFTKLAMIQLEAPKTPKKTQYVVTVHISTKGTTKVQADDMSVLMRDILDKVMKRRVGKETLAKGLNYNLEKLDEPGVAVDLAQPLSAMNTTEFFMVRENSARGMATDTEVVDLNTMADSLAAFQYKLFKVHNSHKLLQKREFHIGISRDQIEITQISKSRPGKSKTLIHETIKIAGCEILDQKSTTKATFRFIYQNSSNKLEHNDFDCDLHVAVEIVTKINNIVDFFASPVRAEYLKSKGEKSSQRKSLYSES